MPNSVTKHYIDQCLDERSGLRDAVRRAPFSPAFAHAYGQRLADRPWFAGEARLREFAADLRPFLDLLVSLPWRLFDGDLAAYCATLGVSPRHAAVMTRNATRNPPRYARPDVYFDGSAFKLLELNICSALGGLDQAAVNRALLEVPEFRAFAEEHRLGFSDTAAEFAAALRDIAAPVAEGDSPVVAMTEWTDGLAAYGHRMQVLQEQMGAAGLDVRLAEAGQFKEKAGKLFLDGTPVDMVLRYFSVDEICSDPSGEELLEPIVRAHESGRTVLHSTLDSYLYSNKGCMYLLSDPRWREAFTAEESALIDRVLPWTRALSGADVVEQALAERDSLILKPRVGYAGTGTVAGWAAGEREWREAVAAHTGDGYIVQRRVTPQAEPVCDAGSGEVADWIAAWSFFFTDHGYAGSSFIRAIPAGSGPIISPSTQPPMRTTSVFTFPHE